MTHRDNLESGSTEPMLTPNPSCDSLSKQHAESADSLLSSPKSTASWGIGSWPWKYEAFAIVLGLVAIVLMLATILPHQGQPLPQWPLSISINTLLSVYAAIFKACLAYVIHSCIGQLQWIWFDAKPRSLQDLVRLQEAGSGGWGSWAWLWTSRVEQQPLVSLGALMAILTLAVDPFVQQIIRPRDCMAEARGVEAMATMPRTSYFNRNNLIPPSTVITILPDAQDALVAGAFNTFENLRGQCTTGNCTFPDFSTAAYCGACEDVSSSLGFSYGCRDYDLNGLANPDGSGVNITVDMSASINSFCEANISAINGIIDSHLRTGQNTSNIWDWGGQDVIKGQTNLLTARWYGKQYNSIQHPIYEVVVGQTPFSVNGFDPITGELFEDCENAQSDNWRCRGYGAARCRLYPCVKTYKTTVENGIVDEQLQASTTLKDLETIPHWNVSFRGVAESNIFLLLIDTQCASASDLQELVDRGVDISSRWVAYDTSDSDFNITAAISSDQSASFPGSLFQMKCAFMWWGFTDMSIHGFLRSSRFMTGEVNGTLSALGRNVGYSIHNFVGPQELQRLYNRGSISLDTVGGAFENMAASLSQYIRTHGHENFSEPVVGTTWHYSICQDVEWAWVAMPAALWLGVTVLLFLTAVSTVRTATPVWKSSPLPMIFHGPFSQVEGEKEAVNHPERPESIPSMEQRALGVRVQLDRSGRDVGLRIISKV